jgi:hypothetical protein
MASNGQKINLAWLLLPLLALGCYRPPETLAESKVKNGVTTHVYNGDPDLERTHEGGGMGHVQ